MTNFFSCRKSFWTSITFLLLVLIGLKRIHCYVFALQVEKFHTDLALVYIEDMKSGETLKRQQFRQLILKSTLVNLPFILSKLENLPANISADLHYEKAIIYGKVRRGINQFLEDTFHALHAGWSYYMQLFSDGGSWKSSQDLCPEYWGLCRGRTILQSNDTRQIPTGKGETLASTIHNFAGVCQVGFLFSIEQKSAWEILDPKAEPILLCIGKLSQAENNVNVLLKLTAYKMQWICSRGVAMSFSQTKCCKSYPMMSLWLLWHQL